MAPMPKVIIDPVWPLQSSWIAYDASTNHIIIPRLSVDNVSTRFLVPFKYFITLFSFPQ